VDSIALQRRHEALTAEAFDKLLNSLDPDRQAAAEKYERIRQRLANFFEYRGCSSPDDYADITINCAAKKLEQGSQIYASDPLSFFLGIARNFLLEYWEQAPKRAASLDHLSVAEHPRIDATETMERDEELNRSEAELKCLEECLEAAGQQDRELIVGYYIGEKGQKISNRKRLAADLDLRPAALRLRAFRLREKLERCVKSCFAALGPKQNHSYTN
jgi:DNA-directed RNA polymerase specialized sigma24 family protein